MSIATRFVASWGNRRSPAASFDGNDLLSNTTANFRSADSEGAIEIWFRISSILGSNALFSSSDTGTNTSYFLIWIQAAVIQIRQVDNNGTVYITSGGTTVTDGKWHHLVISSDGATWAIILDGTLETLSPGGGGNSGNWFADTTLRDNVSIGVRNSATPSLHWIGEIGFTRIYSRPMLQPEAAANFVRGRNAPALNGVGLVFDLPMSEGTGEPTDRVGGLVLTRTGATWTIATARN